MSILFSWLGCSVWLLVGFGALILVPALLRRRRRTRMKRDEAATPVCQRCGYDMRGLDIPRCPECGTLRGFTVPLDELGLTEDEVRAGFERRRSAREAASGDHSDDPA